MIPYAILHLPFVLSSRAAAYRRTDDDSNRSPFDTDARFAHVHSGRTGEVK